ncbi:MAG: hypothetical protein Q9203_004809 [Teloschistes exilis]
MASYSPSRSQISAAVNDIRNARAPTLWQSISVQQALTTKDRPVKKGMRVSRTILPAQNETGILQLVRDTIHASGNGTQGHNDYGPISTVDIAGEWTGRRASPSTLVAETSSSESAKYETIVAETTSSLTILYLFGGNFCTGSPASYRSISAQLAELTGGKCCTPGYRLAPQCPFPAALIDVFIAYLSLLYPPPGSYHQPVAPSSIILAGESAGASLCLSVVQIILTARRLQKTDGDPSVIFHGQRVPIPTPAGLTLLSPAPDQTLSLPSFMANADSDILADRLPVLDRNFPACELWPSDPPRGNLYCNVSMLDHPLVSPVVTPSWIGCPPLWIALGGGERLLDGTRLVAQGAANDGVVVRWKEYECMPHIWPFVFPTWRQSRHCWEAWAKACKLLGSGWLVTSRATHIKKDSLEEQDIDGCALTSLSMAEARACMENHQKNARPYTGKNSQMSVL